MALTRKMLSGYGLEAEQIEEIIKAHSETVSALKAERDDVSANLAEKEKEISALQTNLDKTNSDFENFKAETAKKETDAVKREGYKALLKEVGIADKRINAVLKVTNLDDIELNKDGTIKDADKHKERIAEEYADFIPQVKTEGAKTPTPPNNSGNKGAKSKEEIMKIKDTTERQAAWVEYLQNERKDE